MPTAQNLNDSSNTKSEISPKYLNGGWKRPMIPLEATFSSCEPVKPDKSHASKLQQGKYRTDILIPRRRYQEKRGDRSPKCAKFHKVNSIRS